MMTQLRSHCSFACLFGLAWFTLAACGLPPASAATDDEVFSTLDANEDGVLSGKEAATALQFDADKDGEVTKAEYLVGIAKQQRNAGDQKRLLSIDDGSLFAELDTNEDDVLSGKEVKGFEKYDADSDGEVWRQEFNQGRTADRKKVAGPSPEELARQALEKFRQLDTNEDGRLSGKEMTGFEKLDSNGDKRISEKEFVAGFTSTESESTADPVTVFLAMIRTTDPAPFLKACDPEFAKELDLPVLKFVMEQLASSLGTLDPSAKDALGPKRKTTDDPPGTITREYYRGELKFKEGTADATLIVTRNRIVGFNLKSPVLAEVGDRLYRAISETQEMAKSTSTFYTPRCEEFIRLILAGEDDKAFAKYHPDVQKQVGREKIQNVFEVFRTNCGNIKGFELEGSQVAFDGDLKGKNYKLMHLVRGSKQDYLATTTLEFVGLSAHIVGLAVKPAKAAPDSPPSDSGKPAELKWVKVPAAAEGVTFEMPVKPKRTVNEDQQQVSYRADAADQSFVWTVLIETNTENQEPKAKTLFDAVQKQLVTNLEGELLDTDDANAGKHPGRIFFVKAKDDVFFVERTVIVGARIYRFQVVSSEQNKRKRETVVNQFFESAKFLETDDDVPAAPGEAPPAPPRAAPPRSSRAAENRAAQDSGEDAETSTATGAGTQATGTAKASGAVDHQLRETRSPKLVFDSGLVLCVPRISRKGTITCWSSFRVISWVVSPC